MEKHFGLQTFLHHEKTNSKHVNDIAIVVIHWSLSKAGLLAVGCGETMPSKRIRSELLPSNWNENSGEVYSILYEDQDDVGFLMKAVAAERILIVSLLNLKTEKSTDINLTPADFVYFADDSTGTPPVISDQPDDVDAVIQKITDDLVLKLIKKDDKVKPSTTSQSKESKDNKKDVNEDDPLMVGGRRHPRGLDPNMPDWSGGVMPNIGGADLDPFRGGGILGGGMMMDPRGGRGGRDLEPRWDPVGPGVGGFGGHRGRGRGGFGGGRRNFGDEMAPPDFSDDYNNMFM